MFGSSRYDIFFQVTKYLVVVNMQWILVNLIHVEIWINIYIFIFLGD